MRVGVLGAGRMGTMHASTLEAHPEVSDILVADTDPERARSLATSLDAKSFGSIEELLDGSPDAVVIATPTDTHAPLINACLDAGLPIFCEKPVALGLEETIAVAERLRRGGGALQVGFQRRFDAGYLRARRAIEDGSLGRVYSFHMVGHDPAPPPEDYIRASGGIFRDLHIHDFDSVRFLFDSEASEVYATGAVLEFDVFDRYDDVDTSAVLVQLEDGAVGVLTGMRGNRAGYDVRVEIFGSKDSVVIGLDDRTPLHPVEASETGACYQDFVDRFRNAYRAELDRFLDFARGRAPNPCDASDAAQALRLAVAAERSLTERRPVALKEIQSAG
jgi:myo-inositol 2-dehydrogenase/D-chiro-inositol 1-dehydrogenase